MVYLCYIWILLAFGTVLGFIVTTDKRLQTKVINNLFIFGKFRDTKEYNLTSNFLQVPKRWFYHFYLFGLIVHTPFIAVTVYSVCVAEEFPKPLSLILSYIRTPASQEELLPPAPVIVVLLMGEVQMFRRLLECVYVNSYSPGTMSIVIYLTGVTFYCFLGLNIVSVMQEKSLSFGELWTGLDWYHYLLIAMFIYSSYKQHVLNNILANLRRNQKGAVVTDKHLLPEGDLFDQVSCPHYLMEILIYSVYTGMFWWRHSVVNAIWLFVFVNQTFSAYFSHRWYQETFPNYPKERAPIFPFLYFDRWISPPPQKKIS